MKPLATAVLLCALLLAGLGERTGGPNDPLRGVGAVEPGSREAQRDAWFLRAIELALATGSVPHEDRMIDGGELRDAPWPPLFPALVAGSLRHTLLSELTQAERGALAPRRLESLLEFGLPLLGWLAILAVFLTARLLNKGSRRDQAALLSAGIYALAPGVVFAERVGRVDSFALETLIACGLLAAGHLVLRAREDVDATLGGLLGGLLAGLGLACSAALLPVLAALALAVGRAAWLDRRGARRALLLAGVAAAATASLALGSLSNAVHFWPRFEPWQVETADGALHAWLTLAILPAGLLLMLAPGAAARRAGFAVLGVLALVWALIFDPLASSVQLSACLVFGPAVADRAGEGRGLRDVRAWALGLLLLLPAVGWRASATFRPTGEALAARTAWSAGLAWMRVATPSTGPWNHPGARPDAFVLAAPELALEVVAGARRAVLASTPPSVRLPAAARARALRANELLDTPPSESLRVELERARVRYVVVGPDLDSRVTGGLAEVLANSRPAAGPSGFERVWAAEARVGERPVLAIWACSRRPAPAEPPTLRAR